jgi:hypothetical protein
MIEAKFKSMALSLVLIVSDRFQVPITKSFYYLPSAILTAVVYNNDFVILTNGFKLFVHVCDTFTDAVRLVVRWHDDGYPVLHKTID